MEFDVGRKDGVNSMSKIIIKLSSLPQPSKDPGTVTASASPARPVQVKPFSVVVPSSIAHPPLPLLGMYPYNTQMINHSHTY